jgi:triacylglycerol lipase
VSNMHASPVRMIVTLCLGITLAGAGLFIASAQDGRAAPACVPSRDCVILLHGLCRSARSMGSIAVSLQHNGYAVINLDYASTHKSINALAEQALAPAVNMARRQGYSRIHLVTHSMGGIIAKAFLQKHVLPPGSRVVMLAPPNQGSELTDWALLHVPRIYSLAGPAARELGTQGSDSLNGLQNVGAQVGIIAGSGSWNPLFSAILPGDDDGKVSVKRTRLPGMTDFLIVPDTHMMIMFDRHVHAQIVHFLKSGRFDRSLQASRGNICRH